MTNMHNPPHPGSVLREWLAHITVAEAARRLGVTRAALSRVLNGAAGVSAEMDLRLSKALGTTPGVWFNMQADYDLWQAQRRFRAKVRRIVSHAA
ncbi:MAG TPA: HigA family addiction module antitoxin [Rhodanobacteraceae bacterium]|jgi:addiction module HigA family antidote|nr:HigA family addiction module antitoxin [Rhodanobacteraceae bacterium]